MEGRPEAALEAFRRLMARHPSVLEFRDQAGLAACRLGRWREAYHLLRPSVATGLPNQVNWPSFGLAAIESGRLDEAERVFKACLRVYPSTRHAHLANLSDLALRRARRALADGDLPQAQRHARRALDWIEGHERWPDADPRRAAMINADEAAALLRRRARSIRQP
jgi:tetratricopeptide (TPR) repeat protein